jgi:hypothetical protein
MDFDECLGFVICLLAFAFFTDLMRFEMRARSLTILIPVSPIRSLVSLEIPVLYVDLCSQ